MKISEQGLELIKGFEGCYLTCYSCPAGVATIGWGHTGELNESLLELGDTISQETADQLLAEDMAVFEHAVEANVKVDLEQNQFDALVSFAFNCGANALRTSTLLKLLNAGNYDAVPSQLLRWNKVKGKPCAGLTRRRQAEGHLWATGELKFYF